MILFIALSVFSEIKPNLKVLSGVGRLCIYETFESSLLVVVEQAKNIVLYYF